MEKIINENFLVVLKKDQNGLIMKNSEIIPYTIKQEIDEFLVFFDNQNQTLKNLINHILKDTSISQIYSPHNYCEELTEIYQAKLFFKNHIINDINLKIENLKIDINKGQSESSTVKEIFQNLKNDFLNCYKSFSINLAYKKCKEDNNIIAYSHRIGGWSNPKYFLNENFSVEIKTNFGYGSKSYFYVLLKYKEIYLSPFSDWVYYENNRFAEIIRYTKLFHKSEINYYPIIKNEYWEEAMNFVKDACNKSIIDEEKFVKEFIIVECEKMVIGLENILKNKKINFKNIINDQSYLVDKKGHYLMDFRGEKISGALEFVNQILEFKNITEIEIFIKKLEDCNKKILPELLREILVLKTKMQILESDKTKINSLLNDIKKKNNEYEVRFLLLRNRLIADNAKKKLNWDNEFYIRSIENEYTEYSYLISEYHKLKIEYDGLIEKINNLKKIHTNIESYIGKIEIYFNKKLQ